MKSITDLFKNLNPVLKQTSTLLQLVLTYPLTSNEGERSFSALKRLLTSHRSTMGSMDHLARMAIHPGCLSELKNKDIIDIFSSTKTHRNMYSMSVLVNFEGRFCLHFIFYRREWHIIYRTF